MLMCIIGLLRCIAKWQWPLHALASWHVAKFVRKVSYFASLVALVTKLMNIFSQQCSSVEEAIENRNAVYNLQWPPKEGRLLVANFVDPQQVPGQWLLQRLQ